jgi:hypothetical protein
MKTHTSPCGHERASVDPWPRASLARGESPFFLLIPLFLSPGQPLFRRGDPAHATKNLLFLQRIRRSEMSSPAILDSPSRRI